MRKNFLKEVRETRNISQSELAQKAGVSKQLISGFENNRNGVSQKVLKNLAEALNVKTADILYGSDSNNSFNELQSKKLREAMDMVFKEYGDVFDREIIVKISTDLYSMIIEYEEASSSRKKILLEIIEDKIIAGFAAKCFVNNINNNQNDK